MTLSILPMKTLIARLSLPVALAVLGCLTPAWAVSDPPAAINYQGKLLNSSGNAVTDGTYAINFKLYAAATGSSFIWGANYSVVVTGGSFNVVLGEGGSDLNGTTSSIVAALGTTSTPYLGMTVTADPNGNVSNPSEIAPRLRFLASPYAVVAQNARAADTAATATNAMTLNNLSASAFLQPSSAAATTLNGNLTVPTLTATSVSAGSGTVTGNLTVNGTLSASSTSGGGFVPVGAIVMWSGSPNAIPSGWALCNGSGTFTSGGTSYSIPDLRDRFIVGSGSSYTLRDTGGSNTKTLTSAQVPQHRHTFKDTILAEGYAEAPKTPSDISDGAGTSGYEGSSYLGSRGGKDYDNYLWWIGRYTAYAGGNSSGNADAVDIRPPYYALAFIIRVN